MEQWKPIPGYEGLYEASDLGRVRSAPGKITSNARYEKRVWETRIIKPKRDKYRRKKEERVSLWKDGIEHTHLVSRAVAAAWHGAPENGMTVNHINGDFTDNKPSNLEWVTLSENIEPGFKNGLYSSIQKAVTLTDSAGNEQRFSSMSEASRAVGRNKNYISTLLKRNRRCATSRDGQRFAVSVR